MHADMGMSSVQIKNIDQADLAGKNDIIVSPHGNSQHKVTFICTKESTKRKIRSAFDEGRTRSESIFTNLVQKKGGLMNVKSPSDIPKNRFQI